MNDTSSGQDPQAEITGLLKQLYETHRRLHHLAGERIDPVVLLGGQSYMLQEAQQQLRESEARFRGSFASAATGIALATPHGSYVQANAAYCRLVGYTEDELRGLSFASVIHPADLTFNLGLRDELLAGERHNFSVDTRYLTKAGDVVWVRHSVSATLAIEGVVATLMVIAEEIGERKRTEEALRHSEERLRLITDLVPQGIFAKDAAGRHMFANPALAELAGLSVEEILGKDDFDLVADRAQAEAFRADDLAVMRSGRKLIVEEARTDLAGRTRLLQTIKIPFTVADAGEPAVLGVCTDITEQKRIEARFRRLVDSNVQGVFFWNTSGQITDANDAFLRMVGYTRDDLEAGRISWAEMTPLELVEQDRRVLEELETTGVCEAYEKDFIRHDGSRVPIFIGPAMFEDNPNEGFCFVLDLTERKKLEQQFLRAQRLESIGTLAGGVAHDLNNVLLPIMLSIDVLKRQSKTPQSNVILETIAVSAKRGADIVRQLLWYARGMEGQRIALHPRDLLKDLENIIRGTFPKNIRFVLSVPDDIWTFLGDPTQIHQILLNLCVNARDAMPDGGCLTIELKNRTLEEHGAAMLFAPAKPGRFVCIGVTDSGTGIPEKHIDQIFEPFFTTKALNRGTGLGLSTVLAIVRSHDGMIDVSSEPGKGTTFTVFLPAMHDRSDAQPEQPQPATTRRGNGELILVVDDEPAVRAMTSTTLKAFGYRVVTAQNGAEAAAVCAKKKNDIALVITDMMMPVMDGSRLIEALQRLAPAIRIVRTSGLFANVGANGPDAGGNHVLTKPYTAETLLTIVRAILDEARLTESVS